jgi:lysophospholipase L1-like esterase
MANDLILFPRGNKAQLPTLQSGEPGVTLDEKALYIGTPDGNVRIPNKTDIDAINTQVALRRSIGVKIDTPDITDNLLQQILGTTSLNAVPFGVMNGAYTPYITYQHQRGDSEMFGESLYEYSVNCILGYYEKMVNGTTFNRIDSYVYAPDASSNLEYKIFQRDTADAFIPTNETPLVSGTANASEISHNSNSKTILRLPTPIFASTNKYIFILFKATVGKTNARIWNSDAVDPVRHPFPLILTANWSAEIGFSTGGTYKQAAIKLLLENAELRQYDPLEHLKPASISDDMMINPKPNINPTTYEIFGHISYEKYKHLRGDTEMVGNKTYDAKLNNGEVLGFYEKITNEILINQIEAYVYSQDGASMEWRIYLKDDEYTFSLSSLTPIALGTISSNECSHSLLKPTKIKMSVPIKIPANKYMFIFFRSTTGTCVLSYWDTDSTNPVRHGFLYTSANGWNVTIKKSSTGFYQSAIKLCLSTGEFDNIYGELEDTNNEVKNCKDQLSLLPSTANWNYTVALPPKIYCVVGKEMNIYFDNIISDDIEDYYVDVDCTVGIHQNERWTYIPQAAGTNTLILNLYDRYWNKLTTVTTSIIAVELGTKSGVNSKVLVIGDSTTANGIMTGELLNLYNSDPADITLIGTKGTSPNLHEGISGWTVARFYSDSTSPFVFSGAFNFAQYMTVNAFSGLDYLLIHLGINDVRTLSTDTEVDNMVLSNKDKINQMITNIHAYNPSIKICIIVPISPSKNQDAFGKLYGCGVSKARYKRNIHRYSKGIIDNFGSRESELIYLIPGIANLDTVHNMAVENVAANSRNTGTISRQTDGVHPTFSGYYQMADTNYYALKSI